MTSIFKKRQSSSPESKMVVISSSFSAPAEGIIMQQPSIKLFVNEQELGTGDLYITENNVIWGGGTLAAGGAAPTISLAYPTISLHAIQREPTPAVFMVLNYELRVPGLPSFSTVQPDEEDEDFDPAEGCSITELRFMPQNENELQSLYSAMNAGQALHPDQHDDIDEDPYMDEEDEGDEEFEDAEESTAHSEDAASRLRNLHLENSNGTNHEGTDEDAEIGENPETAKQNPADQQTEADKPDTKTDEVKQTYDGEMINLELTI